MKLASDGPIHRQLPNNPSPPYNFAVYSISPSDLPTPDHMPSTRKPGARKGNKNTLKHGIFSQFISPADIAAMAGMSDDSPEDDLAMARVNFAAVMKKRSETHDLKDGLACDRAAHSWLDTINSYKSRFREKTENNDEVWTSFKDALRAANERQHWKR